MAQDDPTNPTIHGIPFVSEPRTYSCLMFLHNVLDNQRPVCRGNHHRRLVDTERQTIAGYLCQSDDPRSRQPPVLRLQQLDDLSLVCAQLIKGADRGVGLDFDTRSPASWARSVSSLSLIHI